MTKEEFRNVCKLAWEKPYGFVVVDLTSNIYIFIHQYGSAQKENTNIQTKSSIKKHINHTQCAFTEHYNIYKMY